jgi:hypothetical protein
MECRGDCCSRRPSRLLTLAVVFFRVRSLVLVVRLRLRVDACLVTFRKGDVYQYTFEYILQPTVNNTHGWLNFFK